MQEIYGLILKQNSFKAQNKKENFRHSTEIIDLSEEFYSLIKIYGNQFDQLKPIISLKDLHEKWQMVARIKSIVFGKEFL